MRASWDILLDAVAEARLRLEAAYPGRASAARAVAVGWATVESDRAEAELIGALGDRIGSFADAPGDPLLGARCRTAGGGPAGFLAVLEPTSEGRLAASLARLDEGPAAVWFELEPGLENETSAPADGPFGPERLLVGGPRDGRYIFLVGGPPGTIAT